MAYTRKELVFKPFGFCYFRVVKREIFINRITVLSEMAEIKPLDELLEHESLLFTGTNEQFQKLLSDLKWEIAYRLEGLYHSDYGLKFLLFRYGEQGYLRLQGIKDKEHQDIKERFYDELDANGLNFNDFPKCGGGDVKARKDNGRTILLFGGRSRNYGKFDENLLRKTLDAHLNKKIKYEIN